MAESTVGAEVWAALDKYDVVDLTAQELADDLEYWRLRLMESRLYVDKTRVPGGGDVLLELIERCKREFRRRGLAVPAASLGK